MLLTTTLAGLLLATTAVAHMQLSYPAPFNATNNPHRTTIPDPYLQYPNDRWTYPCRGYHKLLGTPQGAPTATWQAGSTQSWSITGIGNHYGGSCQVGFSVDGGERFRVATSYEGNCPHRTGGLGPGGQEFEFTVPEGLDAGVALFAWVWYNREQEFNMNCAAINITTADSSSPAPSSAPASAASATQMAPSYESTSITTVFLTAASPSLTTACEQESTANSNLWTTSYGSVASSTASQTTATVSGTDAAHLMKTQNNCTCTCSSPNDISSCTCYCFDPPANDAVDATSYGIHTRGNRNKRALSFNSRPIMLIADDGNGCLTPHTTAELKYPDPGPDVVAGDGMYPLQLPSGNCGAPGTQAYDGSNGEDGHGGYGA